jgi:hypothetical protein
VLLGEQAWKESGPGTPTDIGQPQIITLEQQVVVLSGQLEEPEPTGP